MRYVGPMRLVVIVVLLVGALLAVVAPLATYSLTLAAFGLPHVLCELAYVDRRYAVRAPREVLAGWAILLGVVVLGRVGVYAGLVDRMLEVGVELTAIAVLAMSTWGLGSERPALLRIGAVIAAGALVVGATFAPIATLVTLAILHNLTPLGFFWDALSWRDLGIAAVAGIGVPLVIVAGLPAEWLSDVLATGASVDPLGVGPLHRHLQVYVYEPWQAHSWAENLFRAAVYGQWAHYVAVIGVLPALAPDAAGLVPWPRTGLFALGVIAASLPLLAAFVFDFTEARAMYGFVAAVHAWIEVPVLLWIAAGTRT